MYVSPFNSVGISHHPQCVIFDESAIVRFATSRLEQIERDRRLHCDIDYIQCQGLRPGDAAAIAKGSRRFLVDSSQKSITF